MVCESLPTGASHAADTVFLRVIVDTLGYAYPQPLRIVRSPSFASSRLAIAILSTCLFAPGRDGNHLVETAADLAVRIGKN